jgi:hypothetical protein
VARPLPPHCIVGRVYTLYHAPSTAGMAPRILLRELREALAIEGIGEPLY